MLDQSLFINISLSLILPRNIFHFTNPDFIHQLKNDIMGKVVVMISNPDFTSENYDQVWDGIRAAGYEHPKGLISHVGFARPEGGWMVVDVWESAEAFNEFGKILIPIVQKTGRKFPEPVIVPAHYVYQPENVPA